QRLRAVEPPGPVTEAVARAIPDETVEALRRVTPPEPRIGPPAARPAAPGRPATPPRSAEEAAARLHGVAERIGGAPPEAGRLIDPVLARPVGEKIVRAAEELFRRGGVQRDPARLISDQVMELLATDRLPLPEVKAVLDRHGLTFAQLGEELFRPSVTVAASTLGRLGALAQRVGRLAARDPEAQAALRELELTAKLGASELDEMAQAASWWRRADNLRRGLLVSQLTTAVRNAVTQVGRLGLDAAQQALDAGLQRVFRPLTGAPVTAHPADGFEAFLNLVRRGTKQDVEAVLQAFPRQHDRLFGVYASDVATRARQAGVELRGVDAWFTRAERGVDILNTANRFQEWAIRRAVFQAELARRVRLRGEDLGALIRDNRLSALDEADVRAAVDKALDITLAKSPEFGTVGYHFVRLVNQLPGATLAIPFPRFLVNSMRFFLDWSPLGLTRLLGPKQLARLARGDTEVLSRALIGTGLLGAAWQLRNSEWAGERWYELRLEDGRTVDLRPFNPFAAYLFVADIVKRSREGQLNTLGLKDVAQGVLSVNVRAGTGLWLVDKALDQLAAVSDARDVARLGGQLAGEAVAGFLTPLQQVGDLLAEFDARLRVLRDTRTEPFLGPIKARLPFERLGPIPGALTLPEAELPTREGPLLREQPFGRQVTGLSLQAPKTPLERELDRLGFTRPEILPSTGDPEADRLIAQKMGPIAERLLGRVVQAPGFQRLPDSVKAETLRQGLARVRQAARQQAEAADPRLFQRLRLERLPRRQRAVLEELGVGQP
ncbi:MAG TPA: hypothetical protein VNK50_02285, partial [Calidithermus sp.]|nr:hypothetical protein [Calidithermus sp.]